MAFNPPSSPVRKGGKSSSKVDPKREIEITLIKFQEKIITDIILSLISSNLLVEVRKSKDEK